MQKVLQGRPLRCVLGLGASSLPFALAPSHVRCSAAKSAAGEHEFASLYAMESAAVVNPDPAEAKSIFDFSAVDIDGAPTALSKYKGKVTIVVNVASK